MDTIYLSIILVLAILLGVLIKRFMALKARFDTLRNTLVDVEQSITLLLHSTRSLFDAVKADREKLESILKESK